MAGINQKSGEAYVESPDELRIEKDDGSVITFCWKEQERICTGGCQAFDPQYADDETGRFTSCRLINIQIAAASAFSNIARIFSAGSKIPGQDIKPPGVM